jgi:hypothetical protein
MKKPLSVVPLDTDGIQPPRPLGQAGRSLWDRVQKEYDVSDVAGVEMLTILGEASDRISTLRAQIDADGEVIRYRGTIRAHPALRDELANRAFVIRTLQKLGLNYEPVKAHGRPPSPLGWKGSNDD